MTTTVDLDSKKEGTVFVSADPTKRVIRIPARKRYNERGELEVLEGKRYEFKDGRLELTEQDDIEWMRNHPKLNVKFVEVGNEPDRERPTLAERMVEVGQAAASADTVKLAELYEAEESTYNRTPAMEAIKAALTRLEQTEAVAEGAKAPDPIEPVSEPESASEE